MKKCNRCGILAKQGDTSNRKYCDVCKKVVRSEVRKLFRSKNILKIKEYNFRYNKEINPSYHNEWRIKNPNKVVIINQNKSSRRLLKYYTDHIYREKQIFRTACNRIKLFAFHDFTIEEWINKKISANGYCLICSENVGFMGLTMDHNPSVATIKRSYSKKNRYQYKLSDINVVCDRCNSYKNIKTISELSPILTPKERRILYNTVIKGTI